MKLLKTIILSLIFTTLGAKAQNVVEMPNIITPNGDGINDVFRINASGYQNLTCTIMNRHGAVVYQFFGLNGSWDGYTHAGIKVSAGTYYVYVEVSSSDGEAATQQGTLQVQY